MLLQVDIAAGVRSRAAAFEDTVRQSLRGTGIRRTPPERGGAAVKFRTLDPNDAQRAADLIQENDPSSVVTIGEAGEITVGFTETDEERLRLAMLTQTIEIIRRRVDALGTKEPIIQRQGDDRIVVQVPGFDEPEVLKKIIGTTAQLAFRLVDTTSDPSTFVARPGLERLPQALTDEQKAMTPRPPPSQYFVVRNSPVVPGALLIDAQPSFQDSRPVVSFRFNGAGAQAVSGPDRSAYWRAAGHCS